MTGIRRTLLVGALALLALMLTACGSGEVKSAWSDSLEGEGKLRVVTTVAPLSDIARNIGGDRIALRGLIPNGVDSHTFEPKPSDARLLAKADLIILNGLHLEEPTLKLAEANKRQGTEIKLLGENTITERDWLFDFSFPKEAGDPNPHLWMNPKHALRYAELINTWLAEKDPTNKDYYAANLEKYRALLNQLDAGIREAVKTVPEKNRKLVTYHDSWAYWAREYGWSVIGAVQPSDFKEPRPQEVADIIDQIKQEQVPAIFGSEVYPSKVLKQIAKESGATYYDKLRDDDPPGKPSAKNHTYVGMVLEDMQIMLTALGGNTSALQSINPERVYASGQ